MEDQANRDLIQLKIDMEIKNNQKAMLNRLKYILTNLYIIGLMIPIEEETSEAISVVAFRDKLIASF